MGEAWSTLSTLIAGVAVWGAIGFGLDRLFDTTPVLFVIGVLVGKFGAVYMIYVRSTRAEQQVEAERRAA